MLAGCSASGPPRFGVAPGADSYAVAFDAAREVLRARFYQLERVDAQAGVITTAPKPTAGLATPWDPDQSSPGQEVEELFNQRTRTVRITFERSAPDGEAAAAPGAGPTEFVLDAAGVAPLVGRVQVTIWQRQVTHLRLNARSVNLTSQTADPVLVGQGVGARFDVPIERDDRLASRIAREIEARMKSDRVASSR